MNPKKRMSLGEPVQRELEKDKVKIRFQGVQFTFKTFITTAYKDERKGDKERAPNASPKQGGGVDAIFSS